MHPVRRRPPRPPTTAPAPPPDRGGPRPARRTKDVPEPHVPPHLLACLIAVAEEGSLSSATKRLHVTQSAVTRQIGRLERHLGLQLLHRHPRGADPTDHARALLPLAQAVVDANNALLEKAERLRDKE